MTLSAQHVNHEMAAYDENQMLRDAIEAALAGLRAVASILTAGAGQLNYPDDHPPVGPADLPVAVSGIQEIDLRSTDT